MNKKPFWGSSDQLSPREMELRALFDRSAPTLSQNARDRLLGSCLALPSRSRPLPVKLLAAGALAVAAALALVLVPTLEGPPQNGSAPRITASAAAVPQVEEQELPDSPEDWPMLATFALDSGVDEFAMLAMPAADEDFDSVMMGMEALLSE